MNEQMIVWLSVMVLIAAVFIVRSIKWHHRRQNVHGHRARHFIGLGTEREMFYVPGDRDDDEY